MGVTLGFALGCHFRVCFRGITLGFALGYYFRVCFGVTTFLSSLAICFFASFLPFRPFLPSFLSLLPFFLPSFLPFLTSWLDGWLAERLTNCLAGWLADGFVEWLAGCLAGWLGVWLPKCRTGCLQNFSELLGKLPKIQQVVQKFLKSSRLRLRRWLRRKLRSQLPSWLHGGVQLSRGVVAPHSADLIEIILLFHFAKQNKRRNNAKIYTTKMQKDEYFTHTKTYYLLLATCYRIIHIRIIWTMNIPIIM